MNFDVKDELRELLRRMALVERDQKYIPAREAKASTRVNLLQGTADELIHAGAEGSVTLSGGSVQRTNATGHPIWEGSTVWCDNAYILDSDAADIISAAWDGSGDKEEIESYGTLAAANKKHFDDGAGLANADWVIVDPLGLLADVSSGDNDVLFATGGEPDANTLTVITTQLVSGGGGGDPWSGWPGPDPTTGVAPSIIFVATVDDASHVAGTDGTFNFDGTTPIVGTAPASGAAANVAEHAFIDGEKFVCFGDAEENYYAIKILPNIAWLQINQANGVPLDDSEFPFDASTAVLNAAPTSGVVSNDLSVSGYRPQYANDQWLLAVLKSNLKWQPLQHYEKATFKVTTEITARTGSDPYTWGLGEATLLKRTGDNTHASADGAEEIVIKNSTLHTCPVDSIIQAKVIDGDWFWDVADCPTE